MSNAQQPIETASSIAPLEVAARTIDSFVSVGDDLAVVAADGRLSFAELVGLADGLAQRLRSVGVGPGAVVGVLVERSVWLPVALLGVLRSGAAYVPLDPTYPADRVEFMLDDSGTDVVVCGRDLQRSVPGERQVVVVEDSEPTTAADNGEVERSESDLAYVIYTSGSTGRPKGVMVEHAGVVNLMEAMAGMLSFGPGQALLGVTTPAFDLSVPDWYLPLTQGATLVIATREQASDPRGLIELIESAGVSVMQATPATWRMLVDAGWRAPDGFRAVCGGDALPRALANELAGRVDELWNFYGPTEATVWATAGRVEPGDGPVPVGQPLANMAIEIRDGDQLVAAGETGEVCIGGVGVARGYLNRPELSAEKFVAADDGGRVYRTGDLGRLSENGELHLLGRADHQVKLRGYRIELGEIETVIADHANVHEAAAIVREDRPGEQRLVAYAVAAAGATIDTHELREHAAVKLPPYMVPVTIVELDELPLTQNGKLDRNHLPEPLHNTTTEHTPARTPLEERLVKIWEESLGISPIGVTDNFFDLGIDSLVAARLFARIEREFDHKLPLAPVFQAPSIDRLAELLMDGQDRPRWSSLVPLKPDGSRPPIVAVHGGAGTILFYNDMARSVGPEQPLYALQAVGLYGDEAPLTSVEDQAERYIRELKSAKPEGPYIIGGYCYGGLVALEIANRLVEAGDEVLLLAMFNSTSPTYNARYGAEAQELDDAVDENRIGLGAPAGEPLVHGAARHWSAASGPLHRRAAALVRAGGRRVRALVRGAYRRYVRTWIFELAMRRGGPLPDSVREGIYFQLIAARAMRVYTARPFPGRIVAFRAEGLYEEEDLGWGPFAGEGVEAIEIPGRHSRPRVSMEGPNSEFIAAHLERSIARALEARTASAAP